MKLLNAFAVLFVAASLVACGASRQVGWERDVQAVSGDEQSTLEAANAAWDQRLEKASLEQAIDLYEKAAAINPNNLDTLTRIARGYYFLADGHYLGNEEMQLKYYDLGTAAGERALALDPAFKASEDRWESEVLAELGAEYMPALYWTASCLGKWAKLQGFTTLLKKKNQVKAMVETVTAKNPEYFYHAPDRYWGVYYSVAPSFAGGDKELAKQKFEASLAGSPDYLGTKVLFADTYATEVQDIELYKKLLNEVLAADPSSLADIVPEQTIEQKKAKMLLDPETRLDRFGVE